MDEVKVDTNDDQITSDESKEIKDKHDQDIRTSNSDRLFEVYDQIARTEDIAIKTAAFMTTTNYFNYALIISNEINGRQGKNRLTVDYTTANLMRYSYDTDVNDILDKELIEIEIDIINTYLADKQELPNSAKSSAGILSRVKSIYIMLTTTDQYSLIISTNIPKYMLGMVSKLFTKLQEIQNEILNLWIEWLTNNGNKEMADIVKTVGNEFWGSAGIKSNVIYDRYFGHMQDRISNPAKTYEMYLNYRIEYRKSTKNILPSRLYEIFDITPDQYRRGKENVISEIKILFPENENKDVIRRLIFEQ